MNHRTSLQRKKLCENYCKHAEAGYSDDSFPDCSVEVFGDYSERYPADFPPGKIEASRRKRLKFWEELAIEGKINASVWTFNMKNRFGWRDRPSADAEKEEKVENIEVTIVKCETSDVKRM
jgi:hypothetical protein